MRITTMLLPEPDVPVRSTMKVRATEDNAKAIQEVRRISSSGADIDDLTLPAGSEPVVLTNELRRNFARIAPA